jgi:competence protein CoiA
MKYAVVNGERIEPKPSLKGICQSCNLPMIAKCGEVRVWHWSHAGKRTCDPWWENETEWHRSWKNQFPIDWQEIIHRAETGEKHIADVKTNRDWVLEFQHSFLKPEERRARNGFYKKLVWIVDGNRRPRMKKQFFKTLDDISPVSRDPLIRPVFLGFSALLEEWVNPQVPVVFDFGEESSLWCLIPTSPDEMYVHVAEISRAGLIALHQDITTQACHDNFANYILRLGKIVSDYAANRARELSTPSLPARYPIGLSRRLMGFRQYSDLLHRSRRRF